MPCESYEPSPPMVRAEYLCAVLRLLEARASYLLRELPPEVQQWWDVHCERDLKSVVARVEAMAGGAASAADADDLRRLVELARRAERRGG